MRWNRRTDVGSLIYVAFIEDATPLQERPTLEDVYRLV
jgi:hypothetical protein